MTNSPLELAAHELTASDFAYAMCLASRSDLAAK